MVTFFNSTGLESIIKYAHEVDRSVEESEAWSMLIQTLVILQEFRKFGVMTGKLHPTNIFWVAESKVVYYPKSFFMLSSSSFEIIEDALEW